MTIWIKNISKTFHLPRFKNRDYTVLQDLSFTIGEGDFIIVLGESGCGKSTLLSILAGLCAPSSGEIWVDEERITGPHPNRSILFQQPSLLPWLDVRGNIIFGCKLRKDLDKIESRANQLIEIMGLSGFEHVLPKELSLGMAQRVCLARALIGHPRILLLDEPFSALDTYNRSHLQMELLDFWHIENFTAIFVTHDIDEAILLGNRIIMMGGRPSRIIETYPVDLTYPRDMTNPFFFELRTKVLKKFRETVAETKIS